MLYSIITTQPGIYDAFLQTGLIARALSKGVIKIEIHNLHDFSFDNHRSIDDTPSGGGPGMIIRVDVVASAISKIKKTKSKIILLTPQGKTFTQVDAKRLATKDNIIFIAGRFEGYDERIRSLVDEEISIGDYVLTSGDLPAQIIIESISRMIPGFIEKTASIQEESFSHFETQSAKTKVLLEYPQYTRPDEFAGQKIPEILLSGNHQAINNWRKTEAEKRTQTRRPDLLK